MACTVWPPALKKWFDSKFKSLCDEHDGLYAIRVWRTKWYADLRMANQFSERGYVTLGFASLIYNAIFGTIYWCWKGAKEKYKEHYVRR